MNTGFKGCHPTVNIVFYLSVIIFGMLFSHPVCLLLSLFSSFIFYFKLFGKRAVKTLFTFVLPMLLVVTAINALFSHYGVTVLFTLPGGNPLTLESAVNGFVTSVTVVSVILWFFTYSEVVTSDKFMHLFGKKVPSIALIISMALRFQPMYSNKLHEIADAQRGIGQDYRDGNLIDRIKNGSKIIVILVTWALESSIETSDSMKSRGYGLSGRKTYSRWKFTLDDILCLSFLIFTDLILAVSYFSRTLECFYNPQIIIARTNTFAFLSLIFYALMCFLPIIIEIKEEIKWHSLKSKI